MMSRCITATVALSLLCVFAAPVPAAEDGEGVEGLDFRAAPPVPLMALAPCKTAPVIDGKFSEQEWQDASAVSGLARWGGTFDWPGTVAYVTYDAQRLYFAYRCFKSEPGWYGANNRFRDSAVYLDSDVELYLSPDDTAGKTIIYQFCINPYGAVYDVRVMPEIGLTEPGYNPRLTLKTSETQREWLIEGSIDVAQLDPKGFRRGQTWRGNFARSWAQRAWSLRGGPFIARDSMGKLQLAAGSPAIQWLDLTSLHEGKVDFTVAVKNTSDKPRTFRLAVNVTGGTADQRLARADQTVRLAPNERKKLRLTSKETFAGRKGHAELLCVDADGGGVCYRQYLRFDRSHAGKQAKAAQAFKAKDLPMSRDISVTARYGQLAQAIEARVDVWWLRRAGLAPTKVRISLAAKGADKPVLTRDLTHFQKDLAIDVLTLDKKLPFGKYTLGAVALDAGGKELSRATTDFERLDLSDPKVNRPYRAREGRILDWMGNDIGMTDQVLPPWTPIRREADSVRVWNRRIDRAPTGLPARIRSGKADLLAGPVQLIAVRGDRQEPLAGKGLSAIAVNVRCSQADWHARLSGAGLAGELKTVLEYDGLLRYALSLRCDQPVKLDGLYLDIPLPAGLAKRFLLPTGLAALPEGPGEVWASKSVRDDEIMGTLVPYVWIGDNHRGLTFGTDSTQGWYEQPGKSVQTIVRDADGTAHLRVHLVRGPAELKEVSASFCLLPTPTKPRPAGWRDFGRTPEWNYFWFQGWYDFDEKQDGKTVWNWDDPRPGCIERSIAQARAKNQQVLCLPYTNPGFVIPHPMPWVVGDSSPTVKLLMEDWANIPSRWGPIKPVKTYRDWAIATMAYWMKLHGYPGWYMDEVYGADGPDMNLLNGSGWFDRSGNLRGSYHTLDTRALLRRMYAVSHRYGRTGTPMLLIHASSFGMSPLANSFATAICFGEGDWEVHIPGQSILDRIPMDNLEFYNGKAWGYIGTFFGEKLRGDKDKIQTSRRRIHGDLLLYDMTPNSYQLYHARPDLSRMRGRFGIGEPDVTFSGYWDADVPVGSSEPAVKVSVYRRMGKSLLVAVNTDRDNPRATQLTVDPAALGLPAGTLRARDAETDQRVGMKDGRIALELPAREVRFLVVETARPRE